MNKKCGYSIMGKDVYDLSYQDWQTVLKINPYLLSVRGKEMKEAYLIKVLEYKLSKI